MPSGGFRDCQSVPVLVKKRAGAYKFALFKLPAARTVRY